MAEDVRALLDHLHVKKADVLGWSDGGDVALVSPRRAEDEMEATRSWGDLHPPGLPGDPGVELPAGRGVPGVSR